MSGPDKAGFIAAMGKEILTFMELDFYNLVNITPEMKITSGVWALR